MRRRTAEADQQITIEIPGRWSLPPVVRGLTIELRPRDPGVRREYQRLSGDQLATRHLEALDAHDAILRASVRGGSTAAARALLEAGSALLDVDGVAVKVVTSALVRSAEEWVELAGRHSTDALYYAFVGIDAGGDRAASRGMRSFGLRDGVLFVGAEEGLGPEADLKTFLYYYLDRQPTVQDGDLYCAASSYSPVYRLDSEAGEAPGNDDRWRLRPAGPEPVVGLADVVGISAGGHALALRSDGSVWTWGTNHASRNGVRYSVEVPERVAGSWAPAIGVAAGGRHSLVLFADGTVGAFGDNSQGQLGDGTASPSEAVVRVDGVAGAVAVSPAPTTAWPCWTTARSWPGAAIISVS